jgi:hypothetical protein
MIAEKPVCVKYKKLTLSDVIAVDFCWLGKVKSGVKNVLESRVLKWDTRIKGIIKNFCKIRLLGKKARILEDVGVILIPTRYTLNYFSPQTGEKAEGIVKNWTDKEIGALSEGFNTILSVDNCKFEGEIWKDQNGSEIRRDCKVSFIIEK